MTLPNRPNYTPGEKRRERKYQVSDAGAMKAIAKTVGDSKAASKSAATASHSADDVLREELLQVLSGMAPDGSEPSQAARATHIKSLEQHVAKLEKIKGQAETARQRLYADACFQQLPGKEDIMSFSAMLDGNFALPTAESDPLNHLLAGMTADTGLQSNGQTGTTAHGKAPYPIDPQWVSLFQQAGLERQQLINGLAKLDNPGASTDLDATMEMVQDAPTRGKYQRSIGSLHDWGKNRLYQQLRATVLSRGVPSVGFGGRSSPTSPIDSPLRQPPKKRANLSKQAKTVLRAWFEEHLHHPYPTEDEKDWLSAQGGITIEQVNNWFINTRGRKWKPMLRRILDDKEAGVESKLYDRLVQKIEQPYRT
jgi:hypothetical protein